MLPSEPKIFHGREPELELILKAFTQESPRVAILGPGGMGKTSLALAALHHPTISSMYGQRIFIPCDSATNNIELTALIGLHVGLESEANRTKAVVLFFSNSPPTLLVLDNFETPWESAQSRGEVERFLSLLAGIPHLALMACINLLLESNQN
jgi:hypothetical protein